MEIIQEKLKEFDHTLSHAKSIDEIDGAMATMSGNSAFMAAVSEAMDNTKALKHLKTNVDNICSGIIENSGLVKHSRAKPYGYPGDFEVLEHVYNSEAFANSSESGKLIDIWAYQSGLPTAVRQRKSALSFFLSKCLNEGKKTFLSIGAGTAREIRDLNISIADSISFDLLDMDPRTEKAFQSFGRNEKFVKYHILDVFKDPLTSLQPCYDVVYSFGIFDYLPNRYIQELVERVKPLMSNESIFIFALKDSTRYNGWFYDLLCDWRFVQRTREDGFSLAKQFGIDVISTLRTENNVVNIFVCQKIS